MPINDTYNDLFFIDSLHGWMVSTGYPGTSDTGYIIHTSDGGYNWIVQKREPQLFWRVQFLDTNYGYVVGGSPSANIQKTTNGGLNWIDISSNFSGLSIQDLSFINKDTGRIVINLDPFAGGVYKTTNGGGNWVLEKFDTHAYDICFINKDTGWYSTNEGPGKLYRTINSGLNWTLQYTNSSPYSITDIFFLNGNKGWLYADYKKYTTDGGFTWINSQGSSGGYSLKFLNENIGYAGTTSLPPKINKSIDGGVHWGYQTTPFPSDNLVSTLKNDTLEVWASQLIHTTDGGGPIIFTGVQNISSEIANNFKLYQNYPNPFNQFSIINVQCSLEGNIELSVYDLTGKKIKTLMNNYQKVGSYEVRFDGGNLSSGIYFYTLFVDGTMIDTKKAVLLK